VPRVLVCNAMRWVAWRCRGANANECGTCSYQGKRSQSVLTETRLRFARIMAPRLNDSCTVARMDDTHGGREGASSPQDSFAWRKSSRSFNEANCVEVACVGDHVFVRDDHVFVRDSKAVAGGGPCLKLSATAWESLIKSIKDGDTGL
jgi:hypothetical protein